MDQQTWIITFTGDSGDLDHQANALEEFLLKAPADIDVVQQPGSASTQGGWVDLIVTIATSGAAVAAINAISTWIKSTHGASIDIEIEGTRVKAQGITRKNYETTLREVLKSARENKSEK